MNYGRYEIMKEVGRGAMGVVYEAHDPQIDRRVALKVLRQDRLANDDIVRRFLREAKVIGRLNHPNIVTVHDAGQDHDSIYIAMEFVEGLPINEAIQTRSFDLREIIRLGIQAAETLDYAHKKGVVHRDIKPSNIILGPDCQIKITDFGIAHIEDSSGTLQTREGEVMGTPAYMSPEQVLGKTVDGRTDIFSLGVVLYELSTGKRPFGGDGRNLATVFNEIINNVPPEPAVSASISPDLSKIIMQCLSKNPDARFQTGKTLADALRNVVAGDKAESAVSPAGPSLESPKSRKQEGRRYGIPLLITVVLVLMIGVSVYYFRGQKTDMKAVPPKEEIGQQTGAGKQDRRPGGDQKVPLGEPALSGKRAVLLLETIPAGADFSIDGEGKGKTPERIELPLGDHKIKVSLQGYESYEKDVQLKEVRDYPLHIGLKAVAKAVAPGVSRKGKTVSGSVRTPPEGVEKPVPKRALLDVETIPGKANIYVDGSLLGTSPARFELSLGKHNIRLALQGYQDHTVGMKLDEAREYPLKVELKPVAQTDEWVIKPLKDL